MRRGAATYVSYRAKLALSLVSLSLSVVTFALVGRVVATAGGGFVERYGTDYASFAIIGVAVHSIASTGLNCFRAAVRREQLQGTIETLLTSRMPASLVVFLGGLGELVLVAGGGVLFLCAAAGLLGVRVVPSPVAILAVGLYGSFMVGLGLASAGLVLVSKEGEPVSWLFGAVTGLLGGVYFPVDLLPAWLQAVARVLPTTHALALVRAAWTGIATPGSPGVVARSGGIAGATAMGVAAPSAGVGSLASVGSAAPSVGTAVAASAVVAGSSQLSFILLSLQAVASIGVGLAVLRWGYRKARRLGTLGEY